MDNIVTVALDAMGGDNAPRAAVQGAVEALNSFENLRVILVGKEDIIKKELEGLAYPTDRLKINNATEVIETGEAPVKSIQKKKDSSLVVAMRLVKDEEADAVVTAGNTGSVLVGGQLIVKREQGVERSPIATAIPTEKGVSLLIDSGANMDTRPSHLLQFALMGQAYAEKMFDKKAPTVGLLNVGAEEEKGNALTKEAYSLLKSRSDINFIGNIEGNEVSKGKADVIVADGFAGNLILKMYEGVSSTVFKSIKEVFMTNARTKLGALLIKNALNEKLKKFDADKYGGAPLLGLRGLVVKSHGNSKADSFKTAIGQCAEFIRQDINGIIKERIKENA